MRIHAWPADMGACRWYRSLLPTDALRDAGHDTTCGSADIHPLTGLPRLVLPPEVAEDPDCVVVVQRSYRSGVRQAMERLGRGFAYDLDDDLWNVEPENPAHETYSKPAVTAVMDWMVANAAVVTVSTEPLAEVVAQRTDAPVVVVPNALPRDLIVPRLAERPHTILWRGSATHVRDIAIVGYALRRAERAGVRIVLAGADYRPLLRLRDAVMLDDLIAGTPWEHRGRSVPHDKLDRQGRKTGAKVFRRTYSPDEYLALVRDVVQPTISLCPLRDGVFNRSKSAIAAIEAHAVGSVPITSNVPAFRDYLSDGDAGVLVPWNEHEWDKALRRLLEGSWGEWAFLADNGARHAAERSVESLVPLYEAAYGKVLA